MLRIWRTLLSQICVTSITQTIHPSAMDTQVRCITLDLMLNQRGRKSRSGDGFKISERNFLFVLGGRNVEINVHGDCQVVRDVEVEDGEVGYGETSRADQIQDVTTAVGGKADMLGEVEAV